MSEEKVYEQTRRVITSSGKEIIQYDPITTLWSDDTAKDSSPIFDIKADGVVINLGGMQTRPININVRVGKEDGVETIRDALLIYDKKIEGATEELKSNIVRHKLMNTNVKPIHGIKQ